MGGPTVRLIACSPADNDLTLTELMECQNLASGNYETRGDSPIDAVRVF